MSTYANISLEGREFHVRNDGWDKMTIKDTVKEYVKELREKVKPEYLKTAVLNAITAEGATDYYAPFSSGYCEFPEFNWLVTIGKRGGVKIRLEKG